MFKFHLQKSLTIVSMLLLTAAANAVDAVSPRATSTVPRFQSVTPAEQGQAVQMPGVSRAIMPPVTSDESERTINARKLPVGLNPGVAVTTRTNSKPRIASTLRTSGDTSPAAPASIPELARALRNNPDLIYEYVRNNVEIVPIWGLQKGPMGTLLDNQGTSFDQASLMVALLREAGLTASFVKGRINLSAAQITEWLGVDANNACGVIRLLADGQIPTTSINAAASSNCSGDPPVALISLKVDHVWVKASIGGTNYYFDPSYKPHTQKSGIDLAAATGYNAASYLTSAKAGASVTADYVQGINRTNIRNNLTSYASNLASYLRTNKPSGVLDDAIGGMTIIPYIGANLRQATLPNQDTSVALTEWADIPDLYKPQLQMQFAGVNLSYTSDAIYGKRLSITFNGSSQPVVMLDGAVAATGNATAAGTNIAISFSVTHGAYASTLSNQQFVQNIRSGGTFVIGNGWGPSGRGAIELHRGRLELARASGLADTAELMLGSTLAILSTSWIAEGNQMAYIIDRLARTNTLFHHQVGIAGYNSAPYVDLPGNQVSVVSQDNDAAKESAAFFSVATHLSVLESAAVQQTSGVSAVSTVKLIDIAVAGNDKIFDARSANYANVVAPNLVGCTSLLPGFQTAVGGGKRLILPSRCNLNEGTWTGAGYFDILVGTGGGGSGIGAIIQENMAGGFSTTPIAPTPLNSATVANTRSQTGVTNSTGPSFNDPIDMTKGHFLYARSDISVGTGEFPYSLKFDKLYSSGSRSQDGPLGKGWTHSLAVSASAGHDGMQTMGEDSALDAVGTIAEILVALDLMSDPAKPLEKMVIATVGQRWYGDQLIGNTVIVKQGLNGEVFTKLPDGTYNAPPGNNAKLRRNPDGTYSYETANKVILNFNTAGKISTYTHPSGVQVNFSYSGNDLVQVNNSLGRSLTINNSGGRITSVSDGSRSVQYAVDGNGNLSSSTDAIGNATTFQYDLPGRMTKLFYPNNPTIAFATNVYDSLGRVQTQTNANGKLYTYYFAGSRSEEIGPLGASRVSYVDSFGRVLKSINPLGKVTTNEYDGQTRLIKTVFPRGNRLIYTYDDAPCAAQNRCTHNIKSIRGVAPNALDTGGRIYQNFTYENNFNQVATITDGLSQITSYTYTAQGQPLSVTSPADPSGVQPVSSYEYTSFSGPAGFPAFGLQTMVTQKARPGSTEYSKTVYDTSNKFVPQTVTAYTNYAEFVGPPAPNEILTTTYVFDAFGNPIVTVGPRTDVVSFEGRAFDAERRVTLTKDALNKFKMTAYDADGRLIRSAAQIGSQWMVTCRNYSPTGKLLKVWGPAQTSSASTCPALAARVPLTEITYDDLDRPIRTNQNFTAPDGVSRLTDTTYNLDDTVQSVQRAVGSASAQTYASYTYTDNGRVATVKDANNNLTTYTYDGHDRRIQTSYPNPASTNTSSTTDYEQYVLDSSNRLISLRKRNGAIVTLAYDNLNRLTSRTYPNAADNVSFTYDLLGRKLTATGASAAANVSYAYDGAGRLGTTTANGKTLSFQLDPAGNRTRTTWPDTSFYTTTSYDALNRPINIRELDSANLATYAYDDLSRRTTVTLGNNTSTSYGYDDRGDLSTLAHDLSGTAQDISYTYARNQAREITQHSWSNDAYQWAGVPGNATNGTRSYTTNGLNQYTSAAGDTLSYNPRGLLNYNGPWAYTYDINDRLITASKNVSGVITSGTMAYDAEGRLNQTVINLPTPSTSIRNPLYDGVNMVADYDGTDTMVRRYVHGPGVDEPLVIYEGAGTGTKNWQYADHLGSIIGTADGTGTSTAIYTYGPFGESSLTTGIRYGYTGQRSMAALGLLYYKARFYSPSLGRFLQPDPIGYADDLNLYAYVANNPVNFTDPSGLVVNWAKGIKLIPDDAPIYKIGAALGGVGAAAVGAATGDSNLFNTALDGLSATRADNIELLIMLGAGGRGGSRGSIAASELTGAQLNNIGRFVAKVPANAKENLTIRVLPNEGVAAQAASPGRVPGSSAVYEKQIDSTGKTIQYTKTTYDPTGNIVNVKDKINNGVFP